MEEKQDKTRFEDIRIMTLKRWNLPQTRKMLDDYLGDKEPLGDYISYCSHHFIDIEKVQKKSAENEVPENKPTEKESMEDNSIFLPDAYAMISSQKTKRKDYGDREIHAVQSMTLIGPKTEFWGTASDVLYITFIQMAEADIGKYNNIYNEISKVLPVDDLEGNIKHDDFALYYSLDFCDMVLFTKNIPFEKLHNVLWDISLVRKGSFEGIRDSFTICSFGWNYLMSKFELIKNNPQEKHDNLWKDRLSITVNLSVQSLSYWEKLKNAISPYVNINEHRLPGRHDIIFSAEDITGSQVIRVLYELDQLCDDPNKCLGSYDVLFYTDLPTDYSESKDVIIDRDFRDSASALLNKMCKLHFAAFDGQCGNSNYVYETKNSLDELLKNGFSDEFILSVLPSFVAYLDACVEHKKNRTNENGVLIDAELESLRRDYYSALNALSLCTMHNERQFIQAPSFNASYFEVPPKLLAFYSAIAYDISEKLHRETVQSSSYRFVIVPDFRKDINVKPLESNKVPDTTEHVAIINLCERFFFDPAKTVKLLAHEIGHFVGEREREYRTKLIFKALGVYLLWMSGFQRYYSEVNKTIIGENITISENDLIIIMADEFGEYMKELVETIPCPHGIKYLLRDIENFAEAYNYGLSFFNDTMKVEEIEYRWRKKICECLKEDSEGDIRKQLVYQLQEIQEATGSAHLIASSESDMPESNIEVFTRNAIARVNNMHGVMWRGDADSEKFKRTYRESCDAIINAFSETYADLRLYEICGKQFDFEEYKQLFVDIQRSNTYTQKIRIAAINYIANHEIWCETENPVITLALTKLVIQYLDKCRDDSICSELAEDTLIAFKDKDLYNQCNVIDTAISKYRNNMIHFCKTKLAHVGKTFNEVAAMLCLSEEEAAAWRAQFNM